MSETKLVKASTAPFQGMGQVQVIAEMRRMQRQKGRKPEAEPAKVVALSETLKRINAEFREELSVEAKAALDEHNAQMLERHRLEEAQRRVAQLWQSANVPERHAGKKAFEQHEGWASALERARRRVEMNGQVAIIGTFGSGKTQIAVELIREVTSAGKSALFTTATQLLREVKACYRDEAKTTESEVIARHAKPHLLVIDEFHRRKGNDWENEQLFDLINQRYNALKAVVLICNQSRDEFATAMDGAILDRMNETGGIIECTWPSFREG